MSTLSFEKLSMPAASLGRANPLPDLARASDMHARIEIDPSAVSPEDARYMGWGRVNGILPYLLQDGYNRVKRPRVFQTAVLENERLRATFLPSLGGRLWSLTDKEAGRELLYVNPVFQPCNLALRNAWISGGVEWNIGLIGHSPFTVDDMACQTLRLPDGTPVLRMFQYERIRRLFYRVEALLPDGERQLYVRVRIDNATDEDTAVYWWSNMAVKEAEDIRVLVPAASAYVYGYGGRLTRTPVPRMSVSDGPLRGREDLDISHPTTLPQSMDFFFDIPARTRPFIAALDGDGYGICQTSTDGLRGRKLFAWGMGDGGRHWQRFLSREGDAYIELQAGLARTQLEHLPMRGGETVSWVETYGPLHAGKAAVQGDWDGAVAAAALALSEQRGPARALEAAHARLKAELDGRNGVVTHRCAGFARAEKLLLGDAFHTAGLSLQAMRVGAEEKPWAQLAASGAFPCPDPLTPPASYQIGAAWEAALTASIRSGGGDHWYGWYQLGVARAARGAESEARAAFEASLAHAESPWALRCLAVLDAAAGNGPLAADRLCRAASLTLCRPLLAEALEALNQTGQHRRALELAAGLPASIRGLGRVKVHVVRALIATGGYAQAEKILREPILLADVREGETLLTDLWFELCARRRFGRADEEALDWARRNNPPPEGLDFRMA